MQWWCRESPWSCTDHHFWHHCEWVGKGSETKLKEKENSQCGAHCPRRPSGATSTGYSNETVKSSVPPDIEWLRKKPDLLSYHRIEVCCTDRCLTEHIKDNWLLQVNGKVEKWPRMVFSEGCVPCWQAGLWLCSHARPEASVQHRGKQRGEAMKDGEVSEGCINTAPFWAAHLYV